MKRRNTIQKGTPLIFLKSSRNRLYTIWQKMIQRCFNKNCTDYKYYGGKGISVCDLWVEDFLNFAKWATKNGYFETLTIERRKVEGNYSPINCYWATRKQQALNRGVRNDSVLGITGIRKEVNRQKFIARVAIDGQHKFIGRFNSIEEAVKERNLFIDKNKLPNKKSVYVKH